MLTRQELRDAERRWRMARGPRQSAGSRAAGAALTGIAAFIAEHWVGLLTALVTWVFVVGVYIGRLWR